MMIINYVTHLFLLSYLILTLCYCLDHVSIYPLVKRCTPFILYYLISHPPPPYSLSPPHYQSGKASAKTAAGKPAAKAPAGASKVSSKVAAKKPAAAAVASEGNPLHPSNKRNYRIGNAVQHKEDLSRFVKWPRYVRLQRQKKVLYERLKVPPSINQFSKPLDRAEALPFFQLMVRI